MAWVTLLTHFVWTLQVGYYLESTSECFKLYWITYLPTMCFEWISNQCGNSPFYEYSLLKYCYCYQGLPFNNLRWVYSQRKVHLVVFYYKCFNSISFFIYLSVNTGSLETEVINLLETGAHSVFWTEFLILSATCVILYSVIRYR